VKLLAIETATDSCSVALYVDGSITEDCRLQPRGHAELLLPMTGELLAAAGIPLTALDTLAFGCGPGSFTGIRVGVAMVQGLAFGADLPVVGVSTLATLAQGAAVSAGAGGRVAAALDARMGEVYWGTFGFRDGLAEPLAAEAVLAPLAPELDPAESWYGVGSGWAAHPEALRQRLAPQLAGCEPEARPRARDMVGLAVAAWHRGEARPAAQARPVYLRDRVALKAGERPRAPGA
jgi:tRNA threonylcarbamoyladenosine biosynthesis protein TsaB